MRSENQMLSTLLLSVGFTVSVIASSSASVSLTDQVLLHSQVLFALQSGLFTDVLELEDTFLVRRIGTLKRLALPQYILPSCRSLLDSPHHPGYSDCSASITALIWSWRHSLASPSSILTVFASVCERQLTLERAPGLTLLWNNEAFHLADPQSFSALIGQVLLSDLLPKRQQRLMHYLSSAISRTSQPRRNREIRRCADKDNAIDNVHFLVPYAETKLSWTLLAAIELTNRPLTASWPLDADETFSEDALGRSIRQVLDDGWGFFPEEIPQEFPGECLDFAFESIEFKTFCREFLLSGVNSQANSGISRGERLVQDFRRVLFGLTQEHEASMTALFRLRWKDVAWIAGRIREIGTLEVLRQLLSVKLAVKATALPISCSRGASLEGDCAQALAEQVAYRYTEETRYKGVKEAVLKGVDVVVAMIAEVFEKTENTEIGFKQLKTQFRSGEANSEMEGHFATAARYFENSENSEAFPQFGAELWKSPELLFIRPLGSPAEYRLFGRLLAWAVETHGLTMNNPFLREFAPEFLVEVVAPGYWPARETTRWLEAVKEGFGNQISEIFLIFDSELVISRSFGSMQRVTSLPSDLYMKGNVVNVGRGKEVEELLEGLSDLERRFPDWSKVDIDFMYLDRRLNSGEDDTEEVVMKVMGELTDEMTGLVKEGHDGELELVNRGGSLLMEEYVKLLVRVLLIAYTSDVQVPIVEKFSDQLILLLKDEFRQMFGCDMQFVTSNQFRSRLASRDSFGSI